MRCPFCAEQDTRVLDSREAQDGVLTRRRRECEACARRFTTYERVEEIFPVVAKKDGRRKPYDREKLTAGLIKACEKRPVSRAQLEEVVTLIERKLQGVGEKEIASTLIGEEVMKRLPEVDEVAYVRFASVYRSFRDIAEFMDELKDIISSQGASSGRRKGKAK